MENINSNLNKEDLISQKSNNEKIDSETLNLSHLTDQMNYTYDYEINNIKLDESNILNCKMYYYDNFYKENRIINYNDFKDNLKKNPFTPSNNAYKSNFFKRLVSKNKIRFQNREFDLDLSYITERVIAMGFPSYSCEKFYRNDINDIKNYFDTYHNGNVKIYNLCLEKDRIYHKNLFPKEKVSLFPALDHNPFPVKLILEFCVDIILFLIQNSNSVAAIHCKAGKGRTGVMICSYLIFSNLCKNSNDAVLYYGKMRTRNGKGVTIPSQIRYIKYFESFLNANFEKPFLYLIPKIIKEHIFFSGKKTLVKNLLINLQNDSRYFTSPNFFKLNYIKIGPLDKERTLVISVSNFAKKKFKFINESTTFIRENNDLYFIYKTNDQNFPIHSDIKISISNGLNFYICLNLWYSSLRVIDKFLSDNEIIQNEQEVKIDNDNKNINRKNINKSNNIEIEMSEISTSKVKINETKDKTEFIDDINAKVKNGFFIIEENNIELNKNTKNDIINIFENRNSMTSSIMHNSELNGIVNSINENLEKIGKKIIDKNQMNLILRTKDLDKFKEKKTFTNIKVKINYSIK